MTQLLVNVEIYACSREQLLDDPSIRPADAFSVDLSTPEGRLAMAQWAHAAYSAGKLVLAYPHKEN